MTSSCSIAAVALTCLLWAGCSSESDSAPAPTPTPPEPVGWVPGIALPSPAGEGPRGLLDRRGFIHAHSVYSHDACDGEPRKGDEETGAIDNACLDDFRRGLCETKADFVMLTDHGTSFASSDFTQALLYRDVAGDRLVERGGGPTANWLACEDGTQVLVLAGTETGMMPVGLEHHVGDTPEARKTAYGTVDAESIEAWRAAGAVVLVQHTEEWSLEQLRDLPIDGFEMFNLHQNLFVGAGSAIELLSDLVKQPERLPHGDLILMQIVSEDPDYLDMWGTVLASGVKRVTTMGTDCHRNTFPQLMPDGERVDSYRRMMRFFSNHLLTRGGSTYDDTDLKEALRSGRLYGSFDMVGYPDGFDFHARAGGETLEMGDEATLSDGVTLEVTMPAVLELDPAGPQPELTARLLKANTGGWTEVAKDSGDLSFTPTEPGAYRAEIRMKAHHLESYLGGYDALADRDLVWVYSNPIYVVDAAP